MRIRSCANPGFSSSIYWFVINNAAVTRNLHMNLQTSKSFWRLTLDVGQKSGLSKVILASDTAATLERWTKVQVAWQSQPAGQSEVN